MDDLLGLGKSTDKLVDAVARALGAAYRPCGIRREATAEAYRIIALESAKTDAKSRNTLETAKAKAEAEIILADGKQALESRLQARLQHEALRQQQNIERIVTGALDQVQSESTDEEVDEDWLTGFFQHAQNVSSVEMQALWSRVLTLEVGKPGTFSTRALDVLRKMTRREAIAFQAACRLASGYSHQSNRATILHGAICHSWYRFSETPELELGKFGLPFLSRINLAKIGLMYEDGLVTGPLQKDEDLTLCFASTHLKLRAMRGDIKFSSYSLTPIGTELSVLVASDEDPDYISLLRVSLSKFFHVSN